MELNFYKQSATPNRINKSGYLSEVGTVNGVIIKETENSLTPDFIMMTSDIVLNSNYFFCSATSRYYFITSYDFLSGGRIVLHSRVDVLMTFRNEILSSTAWVEVSKDTTDIDEYDMLHNDLPFRQDYKFKGHNELNSLFGVYSTYSGKSIVLIMK